MEVHILEVDGVGPVTRSDSHSGPDGQGNLHLETDSLQSDFSEDRSNTGRHPLEALLPQKYGSRTPGNPEELVLLRLLKARPVSCWPASS